MAVTDENVKNMQSLTVLPEDGIIYCPIPKVDCFPGATTNMLHLPLRLWSYMQRSQRMEYGESNKNLIDHALRVPRYREYGSPWGTGRGGACFFHE